MYPIDIYANTSLDNGLAPTRHHAIMWINDGTVYWHLFLSLHLNELK